jgi:hypothetical protein
VPLALRAFFNIRDRLTRSNLTHRFTFLSKRRTSRLMRRIAGLRHAPG